MKIQKRVDLKVSLLFSSLVAQASSAVAVQVIYKGSKSVEFWTIPEASDTSSTEIAIAFLIMCFLSVWFQ
jgi:hypothetical protein